MPVLLACILALQISPVVMPPHETGDLQCISPAIVSTLNRVPQSHMLVPAHGSMYVLSSKGVPRVLRLVSGAAWNSYARVRWSTQFEVKKYPSRITAGPPGTFVFMYPNSVALVSVAGPGIWLKKFNNFNVLAAKWEQGRLFVELAGQGSHSLVVLDQYSHTIGTYDIDGHFQDALCVPEAVANHWAPRHHGLKSGQSPVTADTCFIMTSNGSILSLSAGKASRLPIKWPCSGLYFADRSLYALCSGTVVSIGPDRVPHTVKGVHASSLTVTPSVMYTFGDSIFMLSDAGPKRILKLGFVPKRVTMFTGAPQTAWILAEKRRTAVYSEMQLVVLARTMVLMSVRITIPIGSTGVKSEAWHIREAGCMDRYHMLILIESDGGKQLVLSNWGMIFP